MLWKLIFLSQLIFCTCEIKSRMTMENATLNKKAVITSKLDSNLRKKLNCYI